MAKKRSKPVSPFLGRWNIVSMTEWDEDYIHDEVPAFIEFGGQWGRGQWGMADDKCRMADDKYRIANRATGR
jgi:hypothetical protein